MNTRGTHDPYERLCQELLHSALQVIRTSPSVEEVEDEIKYLVYGSDYIRDYVDGITDERIEDAIANALRDNEYKDSYLRGLRFIEE